MNRLRISAISFLNTAPLMWDFEHGDARAEFDINYTVPSLCAEALREGTADIGIIPAVAWQSIPDLIVIPDIAIAARGAVQSILLVSTVPVEQIKSVAVDTSSRTSVALLHILFAKYWRPKSVHASSLPKFLPMEPSLSSMLKECDAALLIGDPALSVDRTRYHVLDLAEQWHKHTGKPFVFAFWAVRKPAIDRHPMANELATIFQQSRDTGLANVGMLAREWAPRVGITEAAIGDYLTQHINYSLDSPNRAGLQLFFDSAAELGLSRQARELEFLPAVSSKASVVSR